MSEPILYNLASPPRLTDTFVWCDYIELRCLVHPDKEFSQGDLIEAQEEMSEAQIDLETRADQQDADDRGISLSTFQDDSINTLSAMRQDRRTMKAAANFNHLSVREDLFSEELYPFVVDEENRFISLKEDLTDWHNLYIQLLISSALRYCPTTRRKDLTDPFEKVSYHIFRSIMPDGWEVHYFGKNSSCRYTGHLFDKLTNLAKDVRGTLVAKRNHFDKSDRGDGGLDIVAWHPMEDERSLIPMAFAQCGCTAGEFEMKMLQASPSKLGPHFHVGHEWASYYFMPQSMHDGSDWFRYSDFSKVIVVDRLRILRLAMKYALDASNLLESETVEEAKSIDFY